MTTKKLTGWLAKDGLQDLRSVKERAFQLCFGLLQWPWLLASLYGGTKAQKHRLLDRVHLPYDALPHLGSWKADTYFLHRLVDTIEDRRPDHVVELGSGASSLVIAKALSLHGGGALHSYDQHLPFVEQMVAWLGEHRLDAEFRHAPLARRHPTWPGVWYDLEGVPPYIDLLVIDGPPWAIHPYVRGAAECLFPRLRPGGLILMDDGARPGERIIARRWRRRWPNIEFRFEAAGAKGLLVGEKLTPL